jgi:integrase
LREWRIRSRFARPEDSVFCNRAGGCINHSYLSRRFARLGAGFNWHALRHFAVSCWIEAGLKPKTVQTFAGHSSLAITMDRYGHMFPSDDHRHAMDGIARDLFSGT